MQAEEIPVSNRISLRSTVRALSRISTTRGVYHLVEVWAVIGLAVWFGESAISSVTAGLPVGGAAFGHLIGYVVAAAVIASRQHALMVLGHEAIHKRLSPNAQVNNCLGRFLATFPVFISLSKWSFIHLQHHKHTNTPYDPDRAIYARYPLATTKFRRLLLQDIFGLNVISTLKYFTDLPFVTRRFNRRFLGEARAAEYARATDIRTFVAFWVIVLAVGLGWGGLAFAKLFVVYWLVPYCTLTQVFFRIRGAIEHGNVPDPDNPYQRTRTYFTPAALSFFFAPKQVNYHLEHHLYPSIPFYNLPHMHGVLKQEVYPRETGYVEPFHTSLQKLVRC